MKFKLTEKGDGESFETFRLLIAFVLALAVLVIIISMVNSTNKQAILISDQKLKEGLLSAAKSPGTSTRIPFIIEDLMLSGTISKTRISNYSGLDGNCIALVYGAGITPLNPNTNDILKIKASRLEMNVYAYCDFNDGDHPDVAEDQISTDSVVCPTYCVFFFNKKPDDSLYHSD
ncbi:MAG: hypothetical protein WCX82_00065 [archaeon]|jgi:hypothetical protein